MTVEKFLDGSSIKGWELGNVDMTYNAAKKAYLTIFSTRPSIINSKTGKHVMRPVAMMVSTGRTTADYNWFAEMIKKYLGAKDTDFVKAWVSDSEDALIKGFTQCSLFDPAKSVHLLCELHLKNSVEKKCKSMKFDKEDIRRICDQIFGVEEKDKNSDRRIRHTGLVDSHSRLEYNQQLELLGAVWDQMQHFEEPLFSAWFGSNRGLANKIWSCYGRVARIRAGLGDPPGKVTNNDSENVNMHLKNIICHGQKLAWHQFILKAEELIQGLYGELINAVLGVGTYRLVEDMRSLEVAPHHWVKMTKEEKANHLAVLYLVNIDSDSNSDSSISTENAPDLAAMECLFKVYSSPEKFF